MFSILLNVNELGLLFYKREWVYVFLPFESNQHTDC